MTRVCVTWDREETARLIARCREKLAADNRQVLIETLADGLVRLGCDRPTYQGAALGVDALLPYLEALNRALTVVLDGIAATLVSRGQSRLHHVAQAQASLAAIAAALGQEEERNG